MSHADNALVADILAVLRPSGLSERLRRRLGKGVPLRVILDALPAPRLAELGGEAESPNVVRQRALKALRLELDALEAAGRVRRGEVMMGFDGRGHGLRQGLVDVWRLR